MPVNWWCHNLSTAGWGVPTAAWGGEWPEIQRYLPSLSRNNFTFWERNSVYSSWFMTHSLLQGNFNLKIFLKNLRNVNEQPTQLRVYLVLCLQQPYSKECIPLPPLPSLLLHLRNCEGNSNLLFTLGCNYRVCRCSICALSSTICSAASRLCWGHIPGSL